MKKLIILSFVCTLSVLMLVGCQRDQGVQAGNDQGNTGTYQPRPAPAPAEPPAPVRVGQAVAGAR